MSLSILNVGDGDTKLSFDPEKPGDRQRCARIVQDMLKRGYAILVQVGERDGRPLYQSATGFDPDTCEYFIVGLPEADEPTEQKTDTPEEAKQPLTPVEDSPRRRGPGRRRRVDAGKTPAVAVARSAGG